MRYGGAVGERHALNVVLVAVDGFIVSDGSCVVSICCWGDQRWRGGGAVFFFYCKRLSASMDAFVGKPCWLIRR